MKRCLHLYPVSIVFMIIILQIISGSTATVADDMKKDGVNREGVQKEVREREKLYRYKCSLCHPLPDTDAYSSYEHWIKVMKAMHEPGRYNESVNTEDDAVIKEYLRFMSQK
ncbi:ATPase (AAA+ superfamily) [Candidatus Scalindua japonica]|uniref:ATPase (AAA+ superfamily) n=1 Tax=Candidatus Scalindua japonica TaxID=1284222 RepID=A0A286U1J2_9BACT|nr:hypothetical protein [Candidatus Scalindua japonica]GAX61995.1 ATPase (AAA+ superfamily) [Candidatus Scalindua japonica]